VEFEVEILALPGGIGSSSWLRNLSITSLFCVLGSGLRALALEYIFHVNRSIKLPRLKTEAVWKARMIIKCFKLTRVQDRHIRIMGDNQILKVYDRHLGRELHTDSGDLGPRSERASLIPAHCAMKSSAPLRRRLGLASLGRPGGDRLQGFSASHRQYAAHVATFNEVVNHACRDLLAKQAGLPIRRLRGSKEPPVSIHDRPGHGLMLSKTARREHARPEVKRPDGLPHRLNQLQLSWRPKDHGKGTPHV
jgi:hypothetical protein